MSSLLEAAGNSIVGNIEKAVLIIPRFDISNKTSHAGPYRLQVQYNPNSLHIRSASGEQTFSSPASAPGGFRDMTFMNVSPITTLTVDLQMEDINNKDAFLWDKFSLSMAGIASTAAAVGSALGKGHVYSVRKYAEALAALTYLPRSHYIQFIWGKLEFTGELQSVNVKYTMFNPQGEPIRATIAISLRDSLDELTKKKKKELCGAGAGKGQIPAKAVGEGADRNTVTDQQDYPHWQRALNEFLGSAQESEVIDSESSLQKLSAILNL